MRYLTFEVIPNRDESTADFPAVLLDVPCLTVGDEDAAARRAYFSAMAYCAGHGADVEDFRVREYDCERRNVGPGGFVS